MYKNNSNTLYVCRTVNAPWTISFELRVILQCKQWSFGDGIDVLKKLLLDNIISVEPQPKGRVIEWIEWLAC